MDKVDDQYSLYDLSGIKFGKIRPELISYIDREIASVVIYEEKDLNNMSPDDYRQLILLAQNRLNEIGINRHIYNEIRPHIQEWYPDQHGHLVQSNVYLRATRPIRNQDFEHIGWHRESFYGAGMEKAHNVWVPIRGVDEMNTLRFIPESQHIPTEMLELYSVNDPVTKRYSSGHKLGFLYSPKVIKAGINFNKAHPINVPENCFSCFPAELIHGAAANNSNKIRFSIDLRIIRKGDYVADQSKAFHFASGNSYFIDIE